MESQKEYLQRRADEEDAAATRASSGKARELHEELATRYRDAALAGLEMRDEKVTSTVPKEFRIIE